MTTRGWRGWLALGLAMGVVTAYVVSVRQVDLAVFLRAGRDVAAGRDPYPPLSSPLLHDNAAYVYPVAVAYLFAPLAALPGAVLIFDLLSGAAVLAGIRLLGVRDPVICAVCLLSTPLVIGLQDGTLNALLFLGVAAAWRWRDRWQVVGLLVALAVVAKVFLWPLLVWLLITRRLRALSAAVVAGGVVGGIGFLAGPLSLGGYDRLLGVLSHIEAPHARSVAGLVIGLGGGYTVATGLAYASAAAVLAGAAVACRHVGDADDVVALTAAIVAALFASPVVWEHYYVLLLVPLLVRGPTVRVMVAVAAGCWLASTPGGTGPLATVGDLVAVLVTAVLAAGELSPGPAMTRARAWATAQARPWRARPGLGDPGPPRWLAAGVVVVVVVVVALAGAGLSVVPDAGASLGAALPILGCLVLLRSGVRRAP